jgi:type III secretion protein W
MLENAGRVPVGRKKGKLMSDFSVQNQAAIRTETAAMPGAARTETQAAGSLAGYQVKAAENPLSTLADAAEELTFGVDNTKELALKERKAKDSGPSTLQEQVAAYQELMDQAGQRQNLELLYAFLKNNRSAQAALARAKEQFGGDPGQSWAALKSALEALKDEAPAAALETIEQALAQLESEAGPQIRASILGALEGRNHPALGAPLEQGAAYRQVVCELYDSMESMFAFIVDKYGAKGFEDGVNFLFRSLASDLATDQASHEKAHLEAVGANLGQARILNGAHALVTRFLERWKNVHGVGQCELTPMRLLQEVLNLKKDRYLSARNLDALLKNAKAPDIEHEVLFFQELLGTSRNFSPLLFDGVEERTRFIDAVQEAVDQAITREDEWLDSLSGTK